MRKSKKVVFAGLLAIAVLGCGACAKSSEEYIAERLAEMNGGTPAGQVSEEEQQAKDVVMGMIEDLPAVKEEQKNKKEKTSFGTWEGQTYTNEYLGLTCTFDSDWMIYSASELQEIDSSVEDMLEQTDIAKYLEDMMFFKDMMAENAKELTSVNITYSKMSEQEKKYYASMTEKEIVSKSNSSMELLGNTYEQMGMTLKEEAVREIFFLGEMRSVQYLHFDYMGMPYYAIQIYNYHSGDYSTVLTLSSFREDKTTELLNMFAKCK